MKVAFLGATRGMGRALARLMASRGDRLFLLGRSLEDLARSARDLDLGGHRLPASGLDAREVEKVVHEPLHAPCIAEDRGQEAASRLRIRLVGEQRLGVARDRGERRLQLVRHIGHEVAAHRLQPPELGEVMHHQHRAPGRQRARVQQHRSVVQLHLAILDRRSCERRVHHLARRLGAEELR